MDHGAEFGAHRVHQDGKWDSEFKKHIERHGIKPILAKVKHPQTNGKLERWFGEYQRHRLAFSSFEEFREWYNNRPHGSLDSEHLEKPEKAFRRKMRTEMYFAIGHRLFGTMSRNMNYSHETNSEQVRNTFGTTHRPYGSMQGKYLVNMVLALDDQRVWQ